MPRRKRHFEVNLVQNPDDPPIRRNALASEIDRISETVLQLQKDGLNERAVIALIYDKSGIPKGTIRAVLGALGQLKSDYCLGSKEPEVVNRGHAVE